MDERIMEALRCLYRCRGMFCRRRESVRYEVFKKGSRNECQRKLGILKNGLGTQKRLIKGYSPKDYTGGR